MSALNFEDELAELVSTFSPGLKMESIKEKESILNDPIAPASMKNNSLPLGYMTPKFLGCLKSDMVGLVGVRFRNEALLEFNDLVYSNNYELLTNDFGQIDMNFFTDELLNSTTNEDFAPSNFLDGSGNLAFAPIVDRGKVPMKVSSPGKVGDIDVLVSMNGLKLGHHFIMMGPWLENSYFTIPEFSSMNANWEPITTTAFPGKALSAIKTEVDVPTKASSVEVKITPGSGILLGPLENDFESLLKGYPAPQITDELSPTLVENLHPFTNLFFDMQDSAQNKVLSVTRQVNGVTKSFNATRDRTLLGPSLANSTQTTAGTLPYIFGKSVFTMEKFEISGSALLIHLVLNDADNLAGTTVSSFNSLFHNSTADTALIVKISGHTGTSSYADGLFLVDHATPVTNSTAGSQFGSGGANPASIVFALLDPTGGTKVSDIVSANSLAPAATNSVGNANGFVNISLNALFGNNGKTTHWNVPAASQKGTNPITFSSKELNNTNFDLATFPIQAAKTLSQFVSHIPDLTTTLTYETRDRSALHVLISDELKVKTQTLSEVVAQGGSVDLVSLKKGSLLYPDYGQRNFVDSTARAWVDDPEQHAGAATLTTGLFGANAGEEDLIIKDHLVSVPVPASITFTHKKTLVRTSIPTTIWIELLNPSSTKTWNEYLGMTNNKGPPIWNGALGTATVGSSPAAIVDFYHLDPLTLEDALTGSNVDNLPAEDKIVLSINAGWFPLSNATSGPSAGVALSLPLTNKNFMALSVSVNSKKSVNPAQKDYMTSGNIAHALVDVRTEITSVSSLYNPANYGLPDLTVTRGGMDEWFPRGPLKYTSNFWNSQITTSTIATAGIPRMKNAGSVELYAASFLNGLIKDAASLLTQDKINNLRNTEIIFTDTARYSAVSANKTCPVFALRVINVGINQTAIVQDPDGNNLEAPTLCIKTGPFFKDNNGTDLNENSPVIESVDVIYGGFRGKGSTTATRFVIDNATAMSWTAQGSAVNITSVKTGYGETLDNGGRAGIAPLVPDTDIVLMTEWPTQSAEIEFDSVKIMNTDAANNLAGTANFGLMTGSTSQGNPTYTNVIGSGQRNKWAGSGYTIFQNVTQTDFKELGNPIVTKSALEIAGTPLLSIENSPIKIVPQSLEEKLNKAVITLLDNTVSPTYPNLVEALIPSVSLSASQSEIGTPSGSEPVKSELAPANGQVLTSAQLKTILEQPENAGACFSRCKVVDKRTEGEVEFTMHVLAVGELTNATLANYNAIKTHTIGSVTFTAVTISSSQDVQSLRSIGYTAIPVSGSSLTCNLMFKIKIESCKGTFSEPGEGNPFELNFDHMIPRGYFNLNACLNLTTDRINIRSSKGLTETLFDNMLNCSPNGPDILRSFLTMDAGPSSFVLDTFNDSSTPLIRGRPSIRLKVNSYLSDSQADEIVASGNPYAKLEELTQINKTAEGASNARPFLFLVEMNFIAGSEGQVFFSGPINANLYTSLAMTDLDSTVQIGANPVWTDGAKVFSKEFASNSPLIEPIKIPVADNLISLPRDFTSAELDINLDTPLPLETPTTASFQIQVTKDMKKKVKVEIMTSGLGYTLDDSIQIKQGGLFKKHVPALNKIVTSTANSSLEIPVRDEIGYLIGQYLKNAAGTISSSVSTSEAEGLTGRYNVDLVVTGSVPTNYGLEFDVAVTATTTTHVYEVVVSNIDVINTQKGTFGVLQLSATSTDNVLILRGSFIKVGASSVNTNLDNHGLASVTLGTVATIGHANDNDPIWLGEVARVNNPAIPNKHSSLFPVTSGAPSAVEIISHALDVVVGDELIVSFDSKRPELSDDTRKTFTVTPGMLSSSSSSEVSEKNANIAEQLDDIFKVIIEVGSAAELVSLKQAVSILFDESVGYSQATDDFIKTPDGKPFFIEIFKNIYDEHKICDLELGEFEDLTGVVKPILSAFKEQSVTRVAKMLPLFMLSFITLSSIGEIRLKDIKLNEDLNDLTYLTDELLEKPITHPLSIANFTTYREEYCLKSVLEEILERESNDSRVKKLIQENKHHFVVANVQTLEDYASRIVCLVQKLNSSGERHASTTTRGTSIIGTYSPTSQALILKKDNAMLLSLALKDHTHFNSKERTWLAMILETSVTNLSKMRYIDIKRILETKDLEIDATPVLEVCYSDITNNYLGLRRIINFQRKEDFMKDLEDDQKWIQDYVDGSVSHVLYEINEQLILDKIKEYLQLGENVVLDYSNVSLKLKFIKFSINGKTINVLKKFQSDIELTKPIVGAVAIASSAINTIEGEETKRESLGGFSKFNLNLTSPLPLEDVVLDGRTLEMTFELFRTYAPPIKFTKRLIIDPFMEIPQAAIDIGFLDDTVTRIPTRSLRNPTNPLQFTADLNFNLRLTSILDFFCEADTRRLIQSASTLKATTDITPPMVALTCQSSVARTIVSKSVNQIDLEMKDAPNLKELIDAGNLPTSRHLTIGPKNPSDHLNFLVAAFSNSVGDTTHKDPKKFCFVYEYVSPFGDIDYLVLAETQEEISVTERRLAVFKDSDENIVPFRPDEENYLEATMQIGIDYLSTLLRGDHNGDYIVFRRVTANAEARTRETLTAANFRAIYQDHNSFMAAGSKLGVEPLFLEKIKIVSKSDGGVYLEIESATGTTGTSSQLKSVVQIGIDQNAKTENGEITPMQASVVSSSFKTGESHDPSIPLFLPTASVTLVMNYQDSVHDEAAGAMVQSNADTTALMRPLSDFHAWHVTFELFGYIVGGILQDAVNLQDGQLEKLRVNLRDEFDGIVRNVEMDVQEANLIKIRDRLIHEGLDSIEFERNTSSARVKIPEIIQSIIVAILIDLEETEPNVASSISLTKTLSLTNLRGTLYPGIDTDATSGQLLLMEYESYHIVSTKYVYKKDINVFTSTERTYGVRFARPGISSVDSSVRITSPANFIPGFSPPANDLKLTVRAQENSFSEKYPIKPGYVYLESPKLTASSPSADILYFTVLQQEPITGVFEHVTDPNFNGHKQGPNGAMLMDFVFYNSYPGNDTIPSSTLHKILNSTEPITLTSASGEVDTVSNLDEINSKVVNPIFAGNTSLEWTSLILTEENNALQSTYGEVVQYGDILNHIEFNIPSTLKKIIKIQVTALTFVATDESAKSYLVVPSDPIESTVVQPIFNAVPLNDPLELNHPALPSSNMGYEHGLNLDSTDNKHKYILPFNKSMLLSDDVMTQMDPFLGIIDSDPGLIVRALAGFPDLDALMNDDTVSPLVKEDNQLSHEFLRDCTNEIEAEKDALDVDDLPEANLIAIWDRIKRIFILERLLEVVPTAKLKKTTAHQTLDLNFTESEYDLQATEEPYHILVQQFINDVESRLGSFTLEQYYNQGKSVSFPVIENSGAYIHIDIALKIKSNLISNFLNIAGNSYHLGDLRDTVIGRLEVVVLNIPKSEVDFGCEYGDRVFNQEKITMGEISLAMVLGLTCTRGSLTDSLVPHLDHMMEDVINSYGTVVNYTGVNHFNLLSPEFKVNDQNNPLSPPPAVADDDVGAHVERRRAVHSLHSLIETKGALAIGLANGAAGDGVFSPSALTNPELRLNETFAISGSIPTHMTNEDLFTKLDSYRKPKLLTFDNMVEAGTTTTGVSYGLTGTLSTLSTRLESDLPNDLCVHTEASYQTCINQGIPALGSMAYFVTAKCFRDAAKGQELSLASFHPAAKLQGTTLLKSSAEQTAFLDAKEAAYVLANPNATPDQIQVVRTQAMEEEEYVYKKASVKSIHLTNYSGPNNSLGWNTNGTSAEGVAKLFQNIHEPFWTSNQASNFYDLSLNLKIFDADGEIVDAVRKEFDINSNTFQISESSFYKNSTVAKTLPAGSVLFADNSAYGFTQNTNMSFNVTPSNGFNLGQPIMAIHRVLSHLDGDRGPMAIPLQTADGSFAQRRFTYPSGEKKITMIEQMAFGVSRMVSSGPEQPQFSIETSETGEKETFLNVIYQNYSDIANKSTIINLILATKSDGATSTPVFSIFSSNLQAGQEILSSGKFSRASEQIQINLSGPNSDRLVGEDLAPLFIESINTNGTAFNARPADFVGEYPERISGLLLSNHESTGLQSSIPPYGQQINSSQTVKHQVGVPLTGTQLIAFASPSSSSSSLG